MQQLNVPITLSSHIKDALQKLVDDNRVPENYGGCVDTQVSEIEHKSYDGFIPFTNGGFQLTLPTDLRSAFGSGSMPSNKNVSGELERVIEAVLKDSLKEFCLKNAAKLSELFTDEEIMEASDDVINYHVLYELDKGELAEELSEYESEYMTEGGTFFYQFRVMYYADDNARNESGVDELLFMAGTNLDFEYGRDKGLEISYELCVPLKGLTNEMVDTIINDMVKSI